MNNSTLWGNTDWWYTAIGGYGDVSNMLSTISSVDKRGGCGSCKLNQIEGFDGVSDAVVAQVKSDNEPTTVPETQTEMGAPVNAPTILGSQTHTREIIHHRYVDHDQQEDRPQRRSANTRGSRDYEDHAYRGYNGGDFGYNFIPVPVEVPVPMEGPNHDGTMNMMMMMIAIFVMLFIVAMLVLRKK